MNKKAAVIGGGIFGISTALELSKNFDVTLYERSKELLSGASTNNHLRHHQGYHYPRSKSTALECINAQESFEREYGACIIKPLAHYHAIAKEGSKTTPEDYLKFCDELGLHYEIVEPNKIDERLINKKRISLLVKVLDHCYNPGKMLELARAKLRKSGLEVKLSHKITGGEIKGNRKILKVSSPYGNQTEEFDFVINATYSNFNSFNKWFGLPRRKVLYELVEMLEIELPLKEKIALSIFDGQFTTVMPRPEEGRFTLAHIKEEILKEVVSDDIDPEVMVWGNVKTNRENILRASVMDYPIIEEAKVVRPIYITRVVKAGVDATDERPSEITNHGNGLFTIFSGKIVTCVDIAEKVAEMLKYEGMIPHKQRQQEISAPIR